MMRSPRGRADDALPSTMDAPWGRAPGMSDAEIIKTVARNVNVSSR